MNKIKRIGNIKILLSTLFLLFIPFGTYPTESKKITLNFDKADIKTVITAISKITKINYLISPEVKGNVTFVSNAPMNKEELQSALSSILDVHGYKVEREGEHAIILPKVSGCQKKLNEIQALLNS